MKKVQLSQVKPYEAAKHFKMTALKLHGKEETGTQKYWVGLSYFLPEGGSEFDASPSEKVYFVLDGEITVRTKDKEVTLGPWDSVFIGSNEEREIINKTNKVVSMLVIVSY